MFYQGLCVVVESFGEVKLALEDVLINHERIIVCEGIYPRDHFVYKYSQCPPVDRLTMSLVMKDFRGQILGGSAQSESPVFYHLCKSKISEFEVPIGPNQYIFWLEIPVDDVFGV